MTEKTKRNGKGKTRRARVNGDRCKGCELCLAVCPHGSLIKSSTLNARGLHFITFSADKECSACLRCTTMCPDAAIEIVEESA